MPHDQGRPARNYRDSEPLPGAHSSASPSIFREHSEYYDREREILSPQCGDYLQQPSLPIEPPQHRTREPQWLGNRARPLPSQPPSAQAHYQTNKKSEELPAKCRQNRPRKSDIDNTAARFMVSSLRNQRSDTLSSRILRGLIVRHSALDDAALHTLLYTANKIFFRYRLGHVSWQWSNKDDLQFRTELLGTTRTNFPDQGQVPGETELKIILSGPLLASNEYHRNLLLSTFLHELIHCYLFVESGLQHAAICDGHTDGFRKIAGAIEEWIGDDRLKLRNMQARLEDFRVYDNKRSL